MKAQACGFIPTWDAASGQMKTIFFDENKRAVSDTPPTAVAFDKMKAVNVSKMSASEFMYKSLATIGQSVDFFNDYFLKMKDDETYAFEIDKSRERLAIYSTIVRGNNDAMMKLASGAETRPRFLHILRKFDADNKETIRSLVEDHLRVAFGLEAYVFVQVGKGTSVVIPQSRTAQLARNQQDAKSERDRARKLAQGKGSSFPFADAYVPFWTCETSIAFSGTIHHSSYALKILLFHNANYVPLGESKGESKVSSGSKNSTPGPLYGNLEKIAGLWQDDQQLGRHVKHIVHAIPQITMNYQEGGGSENIDSPVDEEETEISVFTFTDENRRDIWTWQMYQDMQQKLVDLSFLVGDDVMHKSRMPKTETIIDMIGDEQKARRVVEMLYKTLAKVQMDIASAASKHLDPTGQDAIAKIMQDAKTRLVSDTDDDPARDYQSKITLLKDVITSVNREVSRTLLEFRTELSQRSADGKTSSSQQGTSSMRLKTTFEASLNTLVASHQTMIERIRSGIDAKYPVTNLVHVDRDRPKAARKLDEPEGETKDDRNVSRKLADGRGDSKSVRGAGPGQSIDTNTKQLAYTSFEYDCTKDVFGSVKRLVFESKLGAVRHCRAFDVKFSVTERTTGIEVSTKKNLLRVLYATFTLKGLSLSKFGYAEPSWPYDVNVKIEPIGGNKTFCVAFNPTKGIYTIHCVGRYRISMPSFTKAYLSQSSSVNEYPKEPLDPKIYTPWLSSADAKSTTTQKSLFLPDGTMLAPSVVPAAKAPLASASAGFAGAGSGSGSQESKRAVASTAASSVQATAMDVLATAAAKGTATALP